MRCARALPTLQLMPAASSRRSPVATPLLGGLPGKTERPHPFRSPHAGHPIHHHVAGPSSVDPDKAGRWHAPSRPRWLHSVHAEALHGLNCNAFTLVRPTARMRWHPPSASRSFVLAALRALHLDPDCGPPPHTRTEMRPTNTKTTKDPTFTGVPNTDKANACCG